MKRKVLVGGVFDIIHFGHIHFLKKAKAAGDYLVVALESDIHVKKLKGTSRPIHDQSKRKEMLESLSFVDEVIILADKMKDIDYKKLVEEIKPSFIAVTEGDPILEKKRVQAEGIGAKLIEIPKIKGLSTTKIAKLLKLEK